MKKTSFQWESRENLKKRNTNDIKICSISLIIDKSKLKLYHEIDR
jgi:hypothetical protein